MTFIACVTILLSLLVSWALLVPIVTGDKNFGVNEILDNSLINAHKREKILSQLEDLEYDFRSGKLTSEQYELTKTELMSEIVNLTKLLGTDSLEVKDNVLSRAA